MNSNRQNAWISENIGILNVATAIKIPQNLEGESVIILP